MSGVRCQVSGVRWVSGVRTEGFSVSLSYGGELTVPLVATDSIIKYWHLAPGT